MRDLWQVAEGDITRLAVDAIVNAANESLLGGGGVDGAIHRAAGPELLAECRRLGGCPTGEARITSGYRLPASHVIHTVGPVWHGGGRGEDGLLEACYHNSLALAREAGIATLAFPAISTGVYRFPLDRAVRIALETVADELARNRGPLQEVTFCTFGAAATEAYRAALLEMAVKPPSSS
jgi:O-acetyl-ADP-ribose deacetylase (regulator of RNase III)